MLFLPAYAMLSFVYCILSVYIVKCNVIIIINYLLIIKICVYARAEQECSDNQSVWIIEVWIIKVAL